MNLIILIAMLLVSTVLPYKFPEKFVRCHKSDPELDNCLKSAIHNAFQLIGSTGIPSLNLPPMDPIELTKLEIGAGTGAVNLVQRYSDIKLFGLSKSTLENAHFDKDQKTLTFTMHSPLIEQRAKYDFDGKVLVLPLFGKGDSVISLYDVTVIQTITFEEETKKNKSYYKIKSYKLSITPNSAHYELDNLFNGDKQLATNILKTLNDNWKEIYDDVKGGLESAYAEIFKGVASQLFNTVPVEEIFLN